MLPVRLTTFTPQIKRILDAGVPVGAGTDAARVASYHPWTAVYWLVSGRTIGGPVMTAEANCLDRETVLRLWTKGSAWFSGEEDAKGAIRLGKYTDFAVLRKTTCCWRRTLSAISPPC